MSEGRCGFEDFEGLWNRFETMDAGPGNHTPAGQCRLSDICTDIEDRWTFDVSEQESNVMPIVDSPPLVTSTA